MIVQIDRSGGFAGVEEDLGEINTDLLDKITTLRVEEVLSEIIRLNEKEDAADQFATDFFKYEINVNYKDGTKRSISILDDGAGESAAFRLLQELLNLL